MVTDISHTGTIQVQEKGLKAPLSAIGSKKTVTPAQRALFSLPPDPIPHPCGGWLPEWLAAEIRAEHPNGFRTIAVWTRCRRCAAIILTGLDDPCVAANAAVDPTPLTPTGELVCALEHRPTYRLHLQGTGARIQARHTWQPPAGGHPPVVPAHNCRHRFPGFILQPAPERPDHAKPPF